MVSMIQEIAPKSIDIAYAPSAPEEDDVVFAFSDRGRNVLLRAFDDSGRLPDRPVTDDYPKVPKLIFPRIYDYQQNAPARIPGLIWLFRIDGRSVFLDTSTDTSLPGFTWLTTRLFRRGLPQELSFAGATAWHLSEWYRDSRFCGRCGNALKPDQKERAMRCPSCGHIVYPRISPAVIIGITDGDRIIISRYADRPYKGRSLIAGYCEIGETLEDTVRREAMEETGLRVKNIRYYRSQPWGFDGALLSGFYCDLDGPDEITVDRSELSEAVWVNRGDIGDVPGTASLTSEMIRNFRDNTYTKE